MPCRQKLSAQFKTAPYKRHKNRHGVGHGFIPCRKILSARLKTVKCRARVVKGYALDFVGGSDCVSV